MAQIPPKDLPSSPSDDEPVQVDPSAEKESGEKGNSTAEDMPSSPSDDEPVEVDPSAEKESGEKEDHPELSDKQIEVITGFIEHRPYFYDMGHKHYKNKHKKEAELEELGEQMGIHRK